MLTSLYTAISGMDATGTQLSVIGDNIANMNTVGFKKSTVAFGDVLSDDEIKALVKFVRDFKK
jgi:flagellar hook protein FlgE